MSGMKKVKKMQFPTSDEAMDYITSNGISISYMQTTSDGVIIAFEESGISDEFLKELEEMSRDPEAQKEQYTVYTNINGKNMYITGEGTSFNYTNAKKFTKSKAENKAKHMTINSRQGYIWDYMKI